MVNILFTSTKFCLYTLSLPPLTALCRMSLQTSRLRLTQALERLGVASPEVAESALSVMLPACMFDS